MSATTFGPASRTVGGGEWRDDPTVPTAPTAPKALPPPRGRRGEGMSGKGERRATEGKGGGGEKKMRGDGGEGDGGGRSLRRGHRSQDLALSRLLWAGSIKDGRGGGRSLRIRSMGAAGEATSLTGTFLAFQRNEHAKGRHPKGTSRII